jgi:hypothetical protein
MKKFKRKWLKITKYGSKMQKKVKKGATRAGSKDMGW